MLSWLTVCVYKSPSGSPVTQMIYAQPLSCFLAFVIVPGNILICCIYHDIKENMGIFMLMISCYDKIVVHIFVLHAVGSKIDDDLAHTHLTNNSKNGAQVPDKGVSETG